jgi:hypothetical protein
MIKWMQNWAWKIQWGKILMGEKSQIPMTKSQKNSKFQIPKTPKKTDSDVFFEFWDFVF